MPTVLVHNAYGKSRVRLTKVQRQPDRHDLFEWSIDVRLTGDFAAAYTAGDNRQIIATDTMKNIVYALAADQTLTSPEAFAIVLGRHFLDSLSAGRARRRFRSRSIHGSGSRSTARRTSCLHRRLQRAPHLLGGTDAAGP